MAVVEITRLPSNVKMPKLLFSLRGILKIAGLKNCKFWVTELAHCHKTDLKKAKIEFLTYEEALQAKEKLDNFHFRLNSQRTVISARMLHDTQVRKRSRNPYRSSSPHYRTSRSRSNSFSRYYPSERVRSRSPFFRVTSSNLDLELELLKKKRLVIEEERRILMEQKKLDMIREYGPGISKDLDYSERSRIRHEVRETTRPVRERTRPIRETRPIRDTSRPRRETSRSIRDTSRPIRQVKEEGVPSIKSAKLPNFYKPCHAIITQMKSIIVESTKPEERRNLEKLICLELRKRLAQALQNESYLRLEKILELYRSKFPETSDTEFITEILKNLRMSHWHLSDDTKKDENDQKNKKTENTLKTEIDPGNLPASTGAIKEEPKDDSSTKIEEAEIKVEDFEVETMDDLEGADEWIEDGIDWNDDENEGEQECTNEGDKIID